MESSTKSKSGGNNLHVGRNPQRLARLSQASYVHMHAYALMHASYNLFFDAAPKGVAAACLSLCH